MHPYFHSRIVLKELKEELTYDNQLQGLMLKYAKELNLNVTYELVPVSFQIYFWFEKR